VEESATMTATPGSPTLYTHYISHFCEKARWALDWHGIPYEEVCWPPGPHIVFLRRLGAPKSTLPLLADGTNLVQGSVEILDWCQARDPGGPRSLVPADAQAAAEARAIEARADEGFGIQVRRLSYAETLPRHAHLFRPALLKCTRPYHQVLGTLVWPITRRLMIRAMKLDPSEAPKSRARVEEELDWLDGLLGDGREYLAGDRFSRADLSVASLLAPFARPPELPRFHDLPLPEALQRDERRWHARPAMHWVRRQYERHRRRSPTQSP
jgi:glutathione S-transferase